MGRAKSKCNHCIGVYNGIPLLVPKNRMCEVIGRVAYFREFGNMLIFIGGGDACRNDVVNCPVHPGGVI